MVVVGGGLLLPLLPLPLPLPLPLLPLPLLLPLLLLLLLLLPSCRGAAPRSSSDGWGPELCDSARAMDTLVLPATASGEVAPPLRVAAFRGAPPA